MATSISVLYGTWNLYKQVEETGSFYDKYDLEDYSDMVFPIHVWLWGERMEELDTRIYDYEEFPSEWKKIEGVAVLEANHAAYEIDEELSNLDLVEVDGVNVKVYDSVYDDADWDIQEIEEIIDLQTGDSIDPWAE